MVLIIISIIAFIKNQKTEFKQTNMGVLVFIAAAVKIEHNIWKWLKQKEYSIIFISPKIVFAPKFYF